jgi:hypothetical protein
MVYWMMTLGKENGEKVHCSLCKVQAGVVEMQREQHIIAINTENVYQFNETHTQHILQVIVYCW